MGEPRSLRCIDIGVGSPALIFHAFGVEPRAYRPLAELLAKRVRVVIPDLFDLSQWSEPWSFQHVLDYVAFTLDDLGIERATLVGHSFGGGLALGLAANRPDRTEEYVFVNTLGPKRQLSLAREAARPRPSSLPGAVAGRYLLPRSYMR